MDLATSALELSSSDHHMSQQQVSPLRPAPIPSGQMLPLAVSSYYSTPPTLLQQQQHHHQHEGTANSATKLKLAHGASGNGLGSSALVKGNEHKSSDQVVADQAREIVRQAVVSAAASGHTENAGGAKGGVASAAKGAKGAAAVWYRECQKNHAASIGGHAIDGCGEFMPSGGDDDDDTGDALRCAACDCHRNFHRREVEGEASPCDCKAGVAAARRGALPRSSPLQPTALASQPPPGPGMTPLAMAAAMSAGAPTDSDDQDDGPGNIVTSSGAGAMHHLALRSPSAIKKRFRTKFTTDQKEKMCEFAEKVGWRIQKHDEVAVQEFCASVGVKRHVLKVWMHNNKHTMGSAGKTKP